MTAGATRKATAAVSGKQENDPRKLAVALVKLVNDKTPPFSFTEGADAVQFLEQKLASVKKELDQWRKLSISMAHD